MLVLVGFFATVERYRNSVTTAAPPPPQLRDIGSIVA
jgi:hypothetical protein